MNSKPSMVDVDNDVNQYYWQELGLNHDPFANTASEILSIEQWEDYFKVLSHLIQYSNIQGVVSGCKGVGKTSFLDQFNLRIEQQTSFSIIKTDANWNAEQFVNEINSVLQLSGKGIFAQSLQEIDVNLCHENMRYIIAIDDAENLSEEILLLLKEWNMNLDDQIKLRFLLVGDTSICYRLKLIYSTQEYADMLSILEMEPLNMEQTKKYLTLCLQAANFQGELLFTSRDIKRIYKESEGVFIKINEKAKHLLIDKLIKSNKISAIVQDNSKLFLASGIVLLILAIFFFSRTPQVEDDQELILPNRGFASNKKPISEDSMISNVTELDDIEIQQGRPFIDSSDHVSEISNYNKQPTHDNLPDSIKVEKPLVNAKMEKSPSDNFRFAKPIKVSDVVKSAKQYKVSEVAKPTEIVDAPKSVNVVKSTKPVDKDIKSNINTHKQVPTKRKIVLSESQGFIQHRADVILDEPNTNYTIQLIATNNAASAANFIISNQLEESANYYINKQQGKTWYPVIYGSYKTKEAARIAVSKMSANLKKNNPWIRKYSEVQKIIRSNSKKST